MTIPRAVFVLPFIIAGCTSPQQRDAEEQQRYNRASESWQSKQIADGSRGVVGANLGANAEGAVRRKANVLGIETEAAKLIFAIDASGSMVNSMERITTQVRNAIAQLPEGMRFNVVLFSEDTWASASAGYLTADQAGKKRAIDFLAAPNAHGSSDPIPGLRAIFAASPDVIFLISDGDFPNNNEVLVSVRKLNSMHKARINTKGVVDPGEENAQLLKTIAQENGGKFIAFK